MDKPISEPFKTASQRLRAPEHANVYSGDIIPAIDPFVGYVPGLLSVYAPFKAAAGAEEAIYQNILASALTPELVFLHRKRISGYLLFKTNVFHAEFSDLAANVEAFHVLLPLVNSYKGATKGSYMGVGGMIANFTADCEKPAYAAHVAALGLTALNNETKSANTTFMQKFIERSVDKEQAANKGKMSEARRATDAAFEVVVNATNVIYAMNEYGAKDPALKENLLKIIVPINAAIHEMKLLLARRRRRHAPPTPDRAGEGSQTDAAGLADLYIDLQAIDPSGSDRPAAGE
ncbi:MAG: DUF6261 family protein [Tannerellaceae bacterium]|jgi:hypothetical protein|nr:DUF6261 family protein [Tannerellaceae bacterium]